VVPFRFFLFDSSKTRWLRSSGSEFKFIPYQEVVEGTVGIAGEEVSFLPQEVVLWT
jgi:hypothetical protein